MLFHPTLVYDRSFLNAFKLLSVKEKPSTALSGHKTMPHSRPREIPQLLSILDNFPLYAKLERRGNGSLVLPDDKKITLSDELVYAATKETTLAQRAANKGV
jgi:hypothetical protein